MVNEHVLVCLILHNILLTLKDEWNRDGDDGEEDDEEDDVENNDVYNRELAAHEEGDENATAKRVRIQNHLINWVRQRIERVIRKVN